MSLGTLGKYERIDVLGHGASGVVYLARDTMLNRQVALKEVDVNAADMGRFLEEARVMDRLRHPNIVHVHSLDRINGKIVIDMEYVRGNTLQYLLNTEGVLPISTAVSIASQTLDALDYAHNLQIVHRDIKPANILVTPEGQVKLVDFGLAEILATNAYAGGAGTYAYMAPEDFASEHRSDRLSDIWAVGITLYESLTGARPFQVENPRDPFSWKRALETQSPFQLTYYIPDAPSGLQYILEKALARDKKERYSSAREFRQALQDLSLPLEQGIRAASPPSLSRKTALMDQPDLQGLKPSYVSAEPGIVVAEVNPPLSTAPARRSLFKRSVQPKLIANRDSLDFGNLHKGEEKRLNVEIRHQGVDPSSRVKVEYTPNWLHVEPMEFASSRQVLTITAKSGVVWETGNFEDTIRISGFAGVCKVEAYLNVLPPRPSFGKIAAWYITLILLSLTPTVLAAASSLNPASASSQTSLMLPALTISTFLMAMFLFVTLGAKLGNSERAIAAILMLLFTFILGTAWSLFSHPNPNLPNRIHAMIYQGEYRASLIGIALGCLLLIQMLSMNRWKLWASMLVCVSLLWSGALLRILIIKP